MRFFSLVATIAAAAARHHDEVDFVDIDNFKAPEVPDPAEFTKASYYRRVKDPNVRARYKNATDRCKGHSNPKKRYQCFKRNWNLYKPHRQNKLNDLRARAQRACWKYKNNILKRNKCYDRYINDYKGDLRKGLLNDQGEHQEQPEQEQEPVQAPVAAAEFSDDDNLVELEHIGKNELSSASSTDSEESATSSEDDSDGHRNEHNLKRHEANRKVIDGQAGAQPTATATK
jgi:hypothetical protein